VKEWADIIIKKEKISVTIQEVPLFETKTWLTKAHSRKLISEEKFNNLIENIEIIGIKLNNYIKTLGPK